MNALELYPTVEGTSKDQLVLHHAGLVKRIARHLTGCLPATVDLDDLIQAGMIGLLEAERNYTPDKGAKFETYAGIRIRGAMLDEVRKSNWTPRSVYRKARQVTESIRFVEGRTQVDAKASDVAKHMGITTSEYHKILRDAAASRLIELDAADGEITASQSLLGEPTPGPEKVVEELDFRERLAGAIEELPERERLVMSMYYDEELNLREIGAVLGVSESRVCQIHGQALDRLRTSVEALTSPNEAGAANRSVCGAQ